MCRYSSAFHCHATLTDMLGPMLIGHQVVVEAIDQLQAFSRYFLCDVHVKQLQLDELYAVLREIKDSKLGQDEAIKHLERYWVWTAVDPESKLLLVIDVGTHTLAMAQCVMHQVVLVLAPGCLPLCLTDGYKDYFTAILTHFGMWVQPSRRQVKGSSPKPRWMPLPQLLYVQVVKSYRRRRIVAVKHRVVLGTMERVKQLLSACGWQINIAFIERLNLDIRQRVAAVGRRVNTLCKGKDSLRQQLALFQVSFNLCLPHASLRQPSASAGSRANQREWFSQAVAAVYTCDGGSADRSWVVAERGTAFSGPTVAAATGVIKGWKDDDRDAELGSCVCKPTWRAE